MSRAPRADHFLIDVVDAPGPFVLTLGEPARILAPTTTLAGSSESRRRGLLGRQALDDEEALVVAPTQAIHTFGMRFPIDVVFVDRRGLVLRVAPAVPRNRIRVSWRAFAAIELAAGRCAAVGVVAGLRIGCLRARAAV